MNAPVDAAHIRTKHDGVFRIAIERVLLALERLLGEHLHVATSTVNSVGPLGAELQHERLVLGGFDRLVKLGRDGIVASVLAGLHSLVLLSVTVPLAGGNLPFAKILSGLGLNPLVQIYVSWN